MICSSRKLETISANLPYVVHPLVISSCTDNSRLSIPKPLARTYPFVRISPASDTVHDWGRRDSVNLTFIWSGE